MSFQEKIDNILKTNKLGINSIFGLEAFVKAGAGAISKPLNRGEEPGLGTIKKLREGLPGLSQDWWDTGKGSPFKENSTAAIKSSDNMKSTKLDIEEANPDYFLVPKTMVQGEYRLELMSEIQERANLWREALASKNELIKQLKEEITELRSVKRTAKQTQ
jgi:hypothetical protein